MNDQYHEPVLVREVLEYLITSPDGVYVDATVGGGGHAKAILESVSARACVICFDRDSDAIAESRKRLQQWEAQIRYVWDIFSTIRDRLHELSIDSVDGILFDLGVSSFQINSKERGFSYQQNTSLDMRMDRRSGKTAADILTTYGEDELADIFYFFGEERKSRRIAKNIVNERAKRAITTSGELADIVRASVGERHYVKSLARIFQALRIEVNGELEHLTKALSDTTHSLHSGGRLVIISYQSLEDRIVKNFLKERSSSRKPADDPLARRDIEIEPDFRLLTKKPIVPDADEEKRNPRSRSAKLRAAERC